VPGQGTVPGTLKHSEFAKQVKGLNNPLLQAEVTYKNGQLVPYGTKGGVRLDVVEYNVDGTIKAVYDLKTGKAGLTTSRIQESLIICPIMLQYMKLDQNEHRLEVKNIMDKKTLQRIIKKYFTTFAEINNFIFYKQQ